ncbi:PPE domain-containing protein [Labedaea rhizosphaerae]|uniref:PPE family protein n=1 Tax=Labedaea rhizosphaerae TaxID=598644 RepID=A0A4R6SN19_LABRH|nr:PPE domain-containing protein [Labedaea rhizosphaerae]TDQ05291.1 PPE family protein [Labedaea rhizosphaerae]
MAGIAKDGGGGLSPHDIYVQITTGPGSGKLMAAQSATQSEVEAEQQRTAMISEIANMINSGWEGSASEAAYAVTKPLIDIGHSRAEYLSRAQQDLQNQIGAFDTARNGVKPVSATLPPTNVLADAVPWLKDVDQATTAYQDDAQNNITVFSAYDTASRSNGERLPKEYPALKDSGDSPEVVLADPKQPVGGTQPGTGSGATHSSTGSGVPSVPSGSTAEHSSWPSAPASSGHQAVPAPQVPAGSTSASSATQPPVYQPGTSGYPQAPAAQGPTASTPYQPFGPYGGTSYGPGGRYGGGSGSGYGGGSGSGYGGGSGSGGGARTGGTPEGGARSGVGAGGVPAEESIARRLNPGGASGRGGMAGMGAMGAGHGGNKDEDAEHERPSFLQEDDPEDIFGTDEVTAPPVIE